MDNKLSVLIADDHSLFRMGLEQILLNHPQVQNIIHCANGIEVLQQLDNKQIDLIFMDIRMPELNGIEATRKIRIKNKTVKIIALTMLDDKASILNMFKAGVNGYITKNASVEEIYESIDTVLNNETYVSKSIPKKLIEEAHNSGFSCQSMFNIAFSKRELEVLKLICQGYTNKEASEILSISIKTIEAHKARLLDKSGATNATGLVRFAYECNYISQF